MKKITCLILLVLMLLSLCACGTSEVASETQSVDSEKKTEEESVSDEVKALVGNYVSGDDVLGGYLYYTFAEDGTYRNFNSAWQVMDIGEYSLKDQYISFISNYGPANRYEYSLEDDHLLIFDDMNNPSKATAYKRYEDSIKTLLEPIKETKLSGGYTNNVHTIVFDENGNFVKINPISGDEKYGQYSISEGVLTCNYNSGDTTSNFIEEEHDGLLFITREHSGLTYEYFTKTTEDMSHYLDNEILKDTTQTDSLEDNTVTSNTPESVDSSTSSLNVSSDNYQVFYATDNINIRSGAGKSYEKTDKVYAGDIIQVFNKVENVDGYTWYEVAYENSGEWIAFDSSWLTSINDEQKAVVDKYSIYDGFHFICKCATDDKYNYWVIRLVGGGDVYATQDKQNVKNVVDFDWSNEDLNVDLLNSLYQAYDFKLVTFKSMHYEGAFTTDYHDIKDCNVESWTVTDSNGTTEYWFVYPYEMGFDLYRATKDSSGTYNLEFLISGE